LGAALGAKQIRSGRDTAEIPRIAALIPCHNKQVDIATVIRDFRAVLPEAAIHVYDNNSDDGTREAARAAGAIVRSEPQQGKGRVVRRMFADIDADIYVSVDGAATYDAASASSLISDLIENHRDMDRTDGDCRPVVFGRRDPRQHHPRAARTETAGLSRTARNRQPIQGQHGLNTMREIVRTNDPVLINAIEALFDGAHIAYLVLDQNMSVLEGSIGMLPRRIMVADEQETEARQLLTDAGLGGELRDQKSRT
jgi:glycosyltransferase involved in cell wall biosynthesis